MEAIRNSAWTGAFVGISPTFLVFRLHHWQKADVGLVKESTFSSDVITSCRRLLITSTFTT